MDRLKPPKALAFEGNLEHNWKIWKSELNLFMVATEASEKSSKIKASILLHCIGTKGREVYQTFEFTNDEEKVNHDTILAKFDTYCTPKKNLTLLRFKYFTCRQKEVETFDQFLTRLQTLSSECDFGTLKESLLRDMVIIGIQNKKLQERLLRDPDITFEKTKENCRACEVSKEQVKVLHDHSASASVSKITRHDEGPTKKNSSTASKFITDCKFCGGNHNRNRCPAYNRSCMKCAVKGHFAKCCTKKYTREIEHKSSSSSESDVEDLFCGVVQASNNPEASTKQNQETYTCDTTSEDWNISLDTNGSIIQYKIDTGAQVNILPYHQYIKLQARPKLHKSNCNLTAYNGSNIPVKGKCVTSIKYKSKNIHVMFVVADTNSMPILGLTTSSNMDLIKRVWKVTEHFPEYLHQYNSCFAEIGCLSKTYTISLDPDVKPTIDPPRRVPIALLDKLKKELQRLVDLKVISAVEEPTDWVSSLVVVEKPNGSLRVCLDPKNLNKAIKRHHYALLTTEDVFSKMAGAKFFTKLDASNAYWQIPVDDESSKLLTFNTPHGRYRFNRMPFGIHSASEICQQAIYEIIEGIEGSSNNQDDVLIWGETLQQLRERTCKVFKSIQTHGLKLNKSKCQFEKSEINFLGHVISAKGVKPDPKKIQAIKDMPAPTNKEELQRFLGMITYLGKFIPNLSDHSEPLRKLLEKDVIWSFDLPQQEAITKLKQLITTTPVLRYFDTQLPTRVLCDASTTGLGAVLEQLYDGNWHPITYASRSLNKSESNYCQIERETLSIVFATHKFHEYLYGRKFVVWNDHMPLKSIFNKSILKAPPRIQRFLLRLQKYDFEMKFIPGKDLFVADTLSRASLEESEPEINSKEIGCYVHSIMDEYPISNVMRQRIASATEIDGQLKVLKNYIVNGWPAQRNNVKEEARYYYNHRDELTILDNMILKGIRILIPKSMRLKM